MNKSKSKTNVNKVNIIPIELNRDASLLHDDLLRETFDTMQLYNDERDASRKHRLMFTLYPICSNDLYNNITEIVYKEGSDDAMVLTNNGNTGNKTINNGAISSENLTRKHAIRNTEYTNEKFKLTYHCGSDIFNNHLLRMKENISVQKRGSNSASKCLVYTTDKLSSKMDAFNTIGDYSRTFNGSDIKIKIPASSAKYTYSTSYNGNLPLYNINTVKTFKDAYSDGIKRENGWMGFYNKTSLSIPVSSNYYVNKCFNNMPGCQFIDVAPERDLFYFTPKKNEYKNRLEYNWECFITYPFKSVYKDSDLLTGNGLPLLKFDDTKVYHEYYNNSGEVIALFRCPVKHNLHVGDSIKLILPENSPSSKKKVTCEVVKVGNHEGKYVDRYFSVRKSDFEDFLLPINNPIEPTRFVRLSNGFECEYYFRKFKKVYNYKTNESLKSTINKLAFSDTIYGDDVSQLVFTDDIDITELRDNRNRPLTELYLTIIKTNAGYKGWYENGKYSDYNENNKIQTVEFSHVFGKVTSGLDLPTFAGKHYHTLRYQHNINNGQECIISGITIANQSSTKIESDINKDMDEFYGDLVEFDPISVTETVLEDVFHRFNTAQREYLNKTSMYSTIYHDEMLGDMYDYDRYGTSYVTDENRIREYKINEGFANLAPEGYIYKPHHKIKIGIFKDLVSQCSDTPLYMNTYSFVTNANYDVVFYTNDNYLFMCGDMISFSNFMTKKFFNYKITEYKLVNDEKGTFIGKAEFYDSPYGEPTTDDKESDVLWFNHSMSTPYYANLLTDGSGRFLWRDIKNPSEMTFHDDLYDIPYTNGSFYHHENITFYVRRQDPFNYYNMRVNKDGVEIENNFEVPTVELDNSEYAHIPENNSSSCF